MVAYVENQKIHHENNNLIPILERDIMDDMLRESTVPYSVMDETWWQEMLGMETKPDSSGVNHNAAIYRRRVKGEGA